MRRATIVVVRALLVLHLVAAALDLPLPHGTPSRARIHLVDRSASVQIKAPGSLDLKDADEIIAHDRDARSGDDTVTWASFGKSVAFESKNVDASGSDLAGALATVLARNPT